MDLDSPTFHKATQQYRFDIPGPPRIALPPAAIAGHHSATLSLMDGAKQSGSNGFDNTDFLRSVALSDLPDLSSVLNWRYEQRRDAQMVLPFLYLGPMSAAKDQKFLTEEKITLILAVRDRAAAQANFLTSRTAERLQIPSQVIDVADGLGLIASFPRGIDMINSHLSEMYQHHSQTASQSSDGSPTNPGKVLVFCETGNERSAVMVVAYIMAMYSMDLRQAVQFVQTRRFAVAFDDPLKHLLSTYEMMLSAKRDVHKASTGGGMTGPNHQKRTLGESDDEEDPGTGLMRDHERFMQRPGLAPFMDETNA